MLPLFKVEAISVVDGEVIYVSRELCSDHQNIERAEILPDTARLCAKYGYTWPEVRYVTKPDGYGDCSWCSKYPQLYPKISQRRRPARPVFVSISL